MFNSHPSNWFSFFTILDNESAKASRRQLKETIHSVLFDMNVPAVCAINQVDFFLDYLNNSTSQGEKANENE